MMHAFQDLKIWIRLTTLIAAMLALAWASVISWEHAAVKRLTIDQARDFSASMHDSTMAGLTALMVVEKMQKKNVFLEQIKQLSVIRDLRIIPSEVAFEGVTSAADEGIKRDIPVPDAREKQVLDSGKELVEVVEDQSGTYLLAIRPLPNVKKYLGKNCLECHDAAENANLGVLSMKIALDKVSASNDTQRNQLIMVAAGVSVPLILLIWFFIQRSVTRPLEKLMSGLRDIASGEGDLRQRLAIGSDDEIGQTSRVFNDMMAKFSALVSHVGQSAAQVVTASRELVAGAEKVDATSRQQNEASARASDAVEGMANSVVAVAQNAEEVRRRSQESLQRSNEGKASLALLNDSVGKVEATVRQINDTVGHFVQRTEAISHITAQMKEIADQTNLLALNAAIEAARAGEQGRGFAVVADEVRKLAEKSSASANEISDITRELGVQSATVRQSLEEGLEHIGTSNQSVIQVEGILAAAGDSVVEVGKGLDEIAAATVEQRRMAADVGAGIGQITGLARENSTAAASTLQSTQHLESLASNLQDTVGRFKT